ncbi:MAG TPA: hypothetical protein VH054_21310, partial [Polyangiaceae bacterium]|nr:hypothetical protein [Polyangiaceae bacterium]
PDVQPPQGCFISGKPDGFAPCGYTELLNDPDACTVDPNADGGTQDSNLCYELCSWDEPDCYYYELPEAGYYLTCGAGCIGRLHDGARADAANACASLARSAGDFLADAARLEAASVDAFEIVATELDAFGAPAELVRAAREAAREERRHARVVAALAVRRGVSPRAPAAATQRARDLRAFAIENAVEGCVRETYGAALATFQAARARAADVREAMLAIAKDESSHAALSFAIDAWLATRLDADARRDVERARENAIAALAAHVESAPRRTFDAELGMPAPDEACAMFAELRRSVWANQFAS